jgi:hypothetical protein
MDVRITELVARLTAPEREREEILVTISTLRAARGEKAAAIKGGPPESGALCQ